MARIVLAVGVISTTGGAILAFLWSIHLHREAGDLAAALGTDSKTWSARGAISFFAAGVVLALVVLCILGFRRPLRAPRRVMMADIIISAVLAALALGLRAIEFVWIWLGFFSVVFPITVILQSRAWPTDGAKSGGARRDLHP